MAHQEAHHLHFLKDFTWRLKYADAKERLNSIGRLTEVAHSIGIDKTTEELLPYLQILVSQCDDLECLKSFLEQLIKLAHFLAGSHNVHQLLPTLEILLKREEEVIQKRALDCLKLYSKDVNVTSFEIHFKPHLHRLSTDNCVSTRRLVCCLYSAYYPRLPFALKDELLNDFGHLCSDLAACVRKSAVICMGELSKLVDFERLRSVIIPLFASLAEDESDSVRIACIDAFIGICGKLIPRNVEQFLIPVMLKLFDDKSYRVRLKTAQTIKELQRAVGPSMSKSFLVPTLSKYFTDPITDVRTASIGIAVDFCSNLEYNARIQFLSEFLLPQLEALYSDPCNKVRAAVCDFIKLSQFLPLDSVKKHFTPAILTLLHDECHAVQSRAAANLCYIKNAVDIAVLSNSINAEMLIAIKLNKFEKLLKIIDALPFYASALGEEFMDEKLIENIIRAEATHKNTLIRIVVLNTVKKSVNILGINWVEKCLLHQLFSLLKKESLSTDQQCFVWAQVILSGLPVVVVNNRVLEYLEELNKKSSIDKSELRSIVFRSIQQAKKTTDDETMKSTVEKLESTLFADPSDREYLQFALTNSDEEVTLPEIFVEPPKANIVNGVQLRRKKFQEAEDKSKRFSLPATPLFDEGSKFDFSLPPSSISTSGTNFLNPSYDLSVSSRRSLNFSRAMSTSYNRISEIDLNPEDLNTKVESQEQKTFEQVSSVTETVISLEFGIGTENKLSMDESDENEPFELIEEIELEKPKCEPQQEVILVTSDDHISNQLVNDGHFTEQKTQETPRQDHGTEVYLEVPEIIINEDHEFHGADIQNKIKPELNEFLIETSDAAKEEQVSIEKILEIIINENGEFQSLEEKNKTQTELSELSMETSADTNEDLLSNINIPEINMNEKQQFKDDTLPEVNIADINDKQKMETLTETGIENHDVTHYTEEELQHQNSSRMLDNFSESKSVESNEEVYVDVVEKVSSSESECDDDEDLETENQNTAIDDVIVETESVGDSDSSSEDVQEATSGEIADDEQFLDAEDSVQLANGFTKPEEPVVSGKNTQIASEFRMTNFLIDFNDDEIEL